MNFLSDIMRTNTFECPYIADTKACYDIFYADNVSGDELSYFLSRGWRKFSSHFFRPACPECRKCVPVRVLTELFEASKSQRRVIRQNASVQTSFGKLEYSPDLFEIYRNHSLSRFAKDADKDEFFRLFFSPPCESLLSEYTIDGELFAGGFLDVAADALSSIYFVYKDSHARLSPGTYSTIAEVLHAKEMGKEYYYLGYFIESNHHMNYKNRFYPHELYDWQNERWIRHDKP